MMARAQIVVMASVIAGLASLGQPALATQDGALIDTAAAFVEVVRGNDCMLSEAEGETLLPAAGLSLDDARDAVALMNRVPLFTVSDDLEHLILLPELCLADAQATRTMLTQAEVAGPRLRFLSLSDRVDPTDAARLVEFIRQNDCALTEAEAEAQMPAMGFSQAIVQDIASLLVEGEIAHFGEGRLALLPALCEGAPADDAARIGALIAGIDPEAGEVLP